MWLHLSLSHQGGDLGIAFKNMPAWPQQVQCHIRKWSSQKLEGESLFEEKGVRRLKDRELSGSTSLCH